VIPVGIHDVYGTTNKNFCFFNLTPVYLQSILKQLTNSGLAKRLLNGMFWIILAAIVSRGAGLIISIPLARFLGKETYGEYGIIYTTMTMFSIVVGSGLSITTTKHIAEYRTTNPNRAGRIIALSNAFAVIFSLVMSSVLAITAPWIAKNAIAAPQLSFLLALSSLGIFLTTINQVQNGTLVGLEAFKSILSRNILNSITRFILLLVLTYCFGLLGTILGMISAEGVTWILNRSAIIKHCKLAGIIISYHKCLTEFSIIWNFSIPAGIIGALSAVIVWVSTAILANRPNGYAEVGLYTMALQWKTAVIFVPLALNNVVLPILANLYGLGENKKYATVLKINILFYLFSTSIAALAIAALSSFIAKLYGPEFINGANVISILAFSSVFFALQELLLNALASRGKIWHGLVTRILSGLIMIVLTIKFTALNWGAYGLGVASVISYAFGFLLQLAFIQTINSNDNDMDAITKRI
jgi:O-antigen/teichoic acid export membrane protein